jgi:hypothetical protein
MTGALAALVLMLAPSALQAQAQQDPQQQVQQWMAEAQRLHMQLGSIHAQAMEHPPIQEAEEAAEKAVREAMIAEDSTVAPMLERMARLVAEARVAQEAGDTLRLQALGAEAASMQPTLEAAQEKALRQPAIEARLDALQESIEARMLEIEPETKTMIARLTELDGLIRTALAGGG